MKAILITATLVGAAIAGLIVYFADDNSKPTEVKGSSRSLHSMG